MRVFWMFRWVMTVALLGAPAVWANPASPLGLWDISGKASVSLDYSGQQYTLRPQAVDYLARFKEDNSFHSTLGVSSDANVNATNSRTELNAIGTWQSPEANKVAVTLNVDQLNGSPSLPPYLWLLRTQFLNLYLKKDGQLYGQIQADSSADGVQRQFGSLKLTLKSYADAATLSRNGMKLSGLSTAVADVSFTLKPEPTNPPVNPPPPDVTITATLTLSMSYKGIRAAAPSACCTSEAGKDQNLTDSDAFLAANLKIPGVKQTASGLQYKILRKGTGKAPIEGGDVVRVWYRGLLPSGQFFDGRQLYSSILGTNIGGWSEGLRLMKEGAWYRFYLPPQLAYGEAGSATIPPSAALIFDVKLLQVNP